MVRYISKDVMWVRKMIEKNPKGISTKDLIRIAHERGAELGNRPRDEKPPGRDKIYQIIPDWTNTYWTVCRGGGRGKHTEIKPINISKTAVLEGVISGLQISEMIKSVDALYKKKNKKFRLVKIIELARLKWAFISYPLHIIYESSGGRVNKDVALENALDMSKTQLNRIKKIEISQKRLDSRFKNTLNNLGKIRDSDLIEAEVLIARSNYKGYLVPRNKIRAAYKLSGRN